MRKERQEKGSLNEKATNICNIKAVKEQKKGKTKRTDSKANRKQERERTISKQQRKKRKEKRKEHISKQTVNKKEKKQRGEEKRDKRKRKRKRKNSEQKKEANKTKNERSSVFQLCCSFCFTQSGIMEKLRKKQKKKYRKNEIIPLETIAWKVQRVAIGKRRKRRMIKV